MNMNFLKNKTGTQHTNSLSPKRKWGMLAILSLALAVIILDTTVLNVALSYIIADLKTNIQNIQWVITIYSLTIAALTVTGGRLGDIFGRKRMFLVGAVLFAIGSFIASISNSVGILILGESLIEGIGAALMMPATASLVVSNFKGRERAIAFGIWGGVAGAASAIGPILGGYLTTHFDWRWGFRINLFVVAIILIGSFLIVEAKDQKEKPELDWLGVFLSATGMLSFIFGIIEASRYGWWKAKEVFSVNGHLFHLPGDLSITPYAVTVGILILTGFILWEKYREKNNHTPLVSPHLFKNKQFTAGILTVTLLSLGQTGLIFVLPVFLQSVRGLNAFETGLSLLPMSLAILITAPLGAALGKKIKPKYLIHTGLFISIISYLVLYFTLDVDTTRTQMIPGLALFGVGMGLVMSHISNLTLSAVSVQEAGEASGVNNTLRQVGATFGSAIIGTILLATLSTSLGNQVYASTVIPENVKPVLAEKLSKQSSQVEFGGYHDSTLPENLKSEIVSISHKATVEANKKSLLYGAFFAMLGFFGSFLLPKNSQKPQELSVQPDFIPEPPKKKKTLSDSLTPSLIAELIHVEEKRKEQGLPGIYADIRYAIDVLSEGKSLAEQADPRTLQARILFEKGWGKELGFSDFETYLKSIPMVPDSLVQSSETFPFLVLVDAHITALRASELLGVQIKGNHQTPDMAALRTTGATYWIRCQDGSKNRGMSTAEAVQNFLPGEQGLNEIEGLSLLAQHSDIIDHSYIDLPQSSHEGFEDNSACLGKWNQVPGMRWRWNDYPDKRCGAASKLKEI